MVSQHNMFKLFAITSFIVMGIILTGCSGGQVLLSKWTDQQISVDGNASEWEGKLSYIPDYNTAVGFNNDGQMLYICLKTNDPMKVLPMLRQGFTIWIEPEKDKSKTIGIIFPLFNAMEDRDPGEEYSQLMFNRQNPRGLIKKMIENQKEIQIFNKEKFPLTLISHDNNNEGITAALDYDSTSGFVYELQLPLENTIYQYKVAAAPGDKINLSFETEEMSREGSGRRMNSGGMRPPGDGGGMSGGGQKRGGGKRNPGMQRPENIEPLNFYVELTLGKGK